MNALLGKLFNQGIFYLKASGGIGFFHEVRRGKLIDFDPGNTHEKERMNGVGFPVELSAGLLKNAGIGLKAKGLVGQDSHIGYCGGNPGQVDRGFPSRPWP